MGIVLIGILIIMVFIMAKKAFFNKIKKGNIILGGVILVVCVFFAYLFPPDDYFYFILAYYTLYCIVSPFLLNRDDYWINYIINQLSIIIVLMIICFCSPQEAFTPITILVLSIPPTIIFLIVLYHDYGYDDEDLLPPNETKKFLLIINFLIMTFLTYMGSNMVFSKLGLPSHDLPMTTHFISVIITMGMITTTMPVLVFIIECLNDRNKLYEDKMFSNIFGIVSIVVLIISMCIMNINKSMENLLRHIAYGADFQYIDKYFIFNDIKNKEMVNVLKKATTRVRLHENGHISLMCIKEKNTLSEIHVFKYDDLEKNTSDEISKIINDCEQNKKESNVGTDMKSAPTKPPAGNMTKE